MRPTANTGELGARWANSASSIVLGSRLWQFPTEHAGRKLHTAHGHLSLLQGSFFFGFTPSRLAPHYCRGRATLSPVALCVAEFESHRCQATLSPVAFCVAEFESYGGRASTSPVALAALPALVVAHYLPLRVFGRERKNTLTTPIRTNLTKRRYPVFCPFNVDFLKGALLCPFFFLAASPLRAGQH